MTTDPNWVGKQVEAAREAIEKGPPWLRSSVDAMKRRNLVTTDTAALTVAQAREAVRRRFSRGPGCGPDCLVCQEADRELDALIAVVRADVHDA